jgi:ferric-dicitrate binding protein FerR (iron transport regulator)
VTRREHLIARLLDDRHALDDEELRELVEETRADPAAARALKDGLLIDDLLSRRLAPGRRDFTNRVLRRVRGPADGAAFVARTMAAARGTQAAPPRRSHARALVTISVAAAATVVLVLASGGLRSPAPSRSTVAEAPAAREPVTTAPAPSPPPPSRSEPARVQRVAGTALLVGGGGRQPAVAGAPLGEGQSVVTVGADAAIALALADGSTLEMTGDGALVPLAPAASGGTALFLARGRITADVRAQPPNAPLVITTPDAQATLLAARFALAVQAGGTRVDVSAGVVHFAGLRGGAATQVAASRYALTQAGGEPVTAARPAHGNAAMLVGGDNPTGVDATGLNLADRLLKQRLEARGFDVRVLRAGPRLLEDARQSDLLVVSDSASSLDVDAHLRELPVPVLALDWFILDDLGMTGPCGQNDECGYFDGQGWLVIKDGSHPLAAGLSGSVRYTTRASQMNWGSPNLHAAWVATVPGFPTRASIFAYDRGAEMPGLIAPARRVALPFKGKAAGGMTEDGWALFDAAVAWAAGR